MIPAARTIGQSASDRRRLIRSIAVKAREYSRVVHAYWIPRRRRDQVSVGTAFHPRTAPLNRKMQWREWSGYFASSVYADFHDIEYNAIREAVALIDVSPLYKYLVSGPDA